MGAIPVIQEPKFEISPFIQQANELSIITHRDNERAGEVLREIAGMTKKIEETFGPMKKAASDAHKLICAKEKENLEPLRDATAVIKQKVLAFNEQQEAIRRAEQERLEREAQAQAEAIRQAELKAAKEEAARQKAERDRIEAQLEAERTKAAEEAARIAEIEAQRRLEEKKRFDALQSELDKERAQKEAQRAKEAYERQERERLEMAMAMEKQRKLAIEQAEQARKQAVAQAREIAASEAVAAPVVVASAPKVAGQSIKKVWKFKVVDTAKIPNEFWILDEARLQKYATAMGSAANVPGVQFYQEAQLSVRA